jgi:hypothetical protein
LSSDASSAASRASAAASSSIGSAISTTPRKREQMLGAHRRRIEAPAQVFGERDHGLDDGLVEAHLGGCRAARQLQRHLQVAAPEVLGRTGPDADLEAFEALRQTAAHVERAAVDAFRLPVPGEAVMSPVGAGKAGHAGDGH